MKKLLHGIFAWAVVAFATPLIASASMFLAIVSPKTEKAMASARVWARLCMSVSGIRLKVEGLEKLQIRQYVIMANHESSVDIPILIATLPLELKTRFMAKKSLFMIPIFGWAIRAIGFVPVDRQHRSTATRSFGEALTQLEHGRSVLIFPEEGRTRDGALLELKRGGFLLAIKTGIPILPLGIDGAIEAMPPDQLLFNPGQIVLRFGTPISTEGLKVSARRELMEEVERQLLDLCDPNIDPDTDF